MRAAAKKLVVDFPSSRIDLSSYQLPDFPHLRHGFVKLWHNGQWFRVPAAPGMACETDNVPAEPQLHAEFLHLLNTEDLPSLRDINTLSVVAVAVPSCSSFMLTR
jgi:hypothetical protein